jgi:hypothetical protein
MPSGEHNQARRFGPYRDALKAIAMRTGTPLPSLAMSFAILHEITAIAPLVGIFYGARALGVGERIVTAVIENDSDSALTRYSWVRGKCKKWVDEGESWAGRVGRRYGVFGFEKGKTTSDDDQHHHLVGDVANAVFAYGLTKVSLNIVVRDPWLMREIQTVGAVAHTHRTISVSVPCIFSGHCGADSHQHNASFSTQAVTITPEETDKTQRSLCIDVAKVCVTLSSIIVIISLPPQS